MFITIISSNALRSIAIARQMKPPANRSTKLRSQNVESRFRVKHYKKVLGAH